jgi:hypothetical protein
VPLAGLRQAEKIFRRLTDLDPETPMLKKLFVV